MNIDTNEHGCMLLRTHKLYGTRFLGHEDRGVFGFVGGLALRMRRSGALWMGLLFWDALYSDVWDALHSDEIPLRNEAFTLQ
jgi:hypothetical protein